MGHTKDADKLFTFFISLPSFKAGYYWHGEELHYGFLSHGLVVSDLSVWHLKGTCGSGSQAAKVMSEETPEGRSVSYTVGNNLLAMTGKYIGR